MQWTLFSELCVLMLKHANRPDITYLGHSENHIVIDFNLNLVMHSLHTPCFFTFARNLIIVYLCISVITFSKEFDDDDDDDDADDDADIKGHYQEKKTNMVRVHCAETIHACMWCSEKRSN